MFDFVTTLAAGGLDFTTVDTTGIVAMIEDAVPSVLTAIIPIVGIRKVISFVMGAIKGA